MSHFDAQPEQADNNQIEMSDPASLATRHYSRGAEGPAPLVSPLATADYVQREAMLFEAGSYPDRQIDVTEADLQRIAANTQEAPIQVGHVEPGLKLGVVKNLKVLGKQLFGTLFLHPEANALIERSGIKGVSVGLPRTLDKLGELSITGTPRVATAALFSEDRLVFSMGETPWIEEAPAPEIELEPNTPPARIPRATGEQKPMSVIEKLKALFSKAGVPQEEIEAELADVTFSTEPEPAVLAELQRLQIEHRAAQAEAWATSEIEIHHRALPAERPAMIAAFVRAAEDDASVPATVTFSQGADTVTGDRVDTLKALFSTRAAHTLTVETLKDEELAELVQMANKTRTERAGEPKRITPERKRQLLNMTPEGRQLLKEQAAGK